VHFVGKQTCMAASYISDLFIAEPACSKAETWNMGLIVLVAVGIFLAVRVISGWRKRFRDMYR
jgi:uncharacterized membrane protein